jgi:hypothetical protein
MPNYLNVEKERIQAEKVMLRDANAATKPSAHFLKKGFRANEERLQKLAAEERALRQLRAENAKMEKEIKGLKQRGAEAKESPANNLSASEPSPPSDQQPPRPQVHFAPPRPETAESEARPETAASVASVHSTASVRSTASSLHSNATSVRSSASSVRSAAISESEQPDAPFRAELMKMPITNLKRFCGEIGASDAGDKGALVARLMAHARKMAAERRAKDGDGGRPSTGASFVEASAFGGARPNFVFKQGARGLGYYKDAR